MQNNNRLPGDDFSLLSQIIAAESPAICKL